MTIAEQITTEINILLDALEADKRPLVAAWVTASILRKHRRGKGSGEHALFWEHSTHEHVRGQVGRCINNRAGDKARPDDPTQPRFPGYDFVQNYYVVKRENEAGELEEVGIHITQMSRDERQEKARLHRSWGAAHYRHADELDRWEREYGEQAA